MNHQLLSSDEAAQSLGIRVLTLYDWLKQSDAGEFQIRGKGVTIAYFQGGRRGQGRIKIDRQEIERLLNLMRVQPRRENRRRIPSAKRSPHYITTPLGRPKE